jgi:hypothetical protein
MLIDVMRSKLVTCPESAHLELIEYVDTPLGMLIASCTRSASGHPLTCQRLCAARLDRRRACHAERADDPELRVGDTTLVSIRI